MIGQTVKDAYLGLVRVGSLPNSMFARLRFTRKEASEGLYIHLGSGQDYDPVMINVEGNLFRKRDIWHDLRNRLRFPTGSAFFVYSSHVLEHLCRTTR